MPSVSQLVVIAGVFVLAGWVKGVVGMGLPTVAMGALGLIMAPAHAAALVVVPSLVTNVWQFAAGPSMAATIRRFAGMMAFACLGTALGIHLLTAGSSRWPSFALGIVLAAYAVIALYMPGFTVTPPAERRWSPVVGAITGVLAGATGVLVVPVVPYLSALGLDKDQFVQALGLSFTVSTVALAVALGASRGLSSNTLLVSTGALVPALAGMFVGQRTRGHIAPAAFRRWFLVVLLLVGGYMVIRSLVAR